MSEHTNFERAFYVFAGHEIPQKIATKFLCVANEHTQKCNVKPFNRLLQSASRFAGIHVSVTGGAGTTMVPIGL